MVRSDQHDANRQGVIEYEPWKTKFEGKQKRIKCACVRKETAQRKCETDTPSKIRGEKV